MGDGLHPIEFAGLTPVGDGVDGDVEQGCRRPHTIAALAALTCRTCGWALGTATLEVMDKPNPLHFACGESPPAATAEVLGVQLHGDLLIRLRQHEFTDASDDGGGGSLRIRCALGARNVQSCARRGLPAYSKGDRSRLVGQRDIFDQQPQEVFALRRGRGRGVPDEGHIVGEGEDLRAFFGVHYQ